MQILLLILLRAYKLALSPMLGHRCRFLPSCADYAHEAIQHYGAMHGSMLSLKRICRCHPFSAGGLDPVPPFRKDLKTAMRGHQRKTPT